MIDWDKILKPKPKSKKSKINQSARLEMFNDQSYAHYEDRRYGNEVYVKHWNGNTRRWQVGRYSLDAFARYKQWPLAEVEALPDYS
jgi:hypothetical protein